MALTAGAGAAYAQTAPEQSAATCMEPYVRQAQTMDEQASRRQRAAAGVRDRHRRVTATLAALRDSDQGLRLLLLKAMQACNTTPGSGPMKPLGEVFVGRDAENLRTLRSLLDADGWPTIRRYGADADQTAFLIVTHADRGPAFQASLLPTLGRLVKSGDTSRQNYAVLYDRVQVNFGRPQRYGSQGACDGHEWKPAPIENVKKVARLRREIGLPPLPRYARQLSRMMCGAKA